MGVRARWGAHALREIRMSLHVTLSRPLAAFGLGILAILPLSAQTPEIFTDTACTAPNYRTDPRPDAKGSPTEVTVGMRLMDLTEIDDVSQTLSVDLAVKMQWSDPRLAGLSGCRMSTDAIWYPALFLRNSGRAFLR